MSSKSSSDSNKQDTNDKDNNSFNPFMEGIALSQSAAISLINTYSEFLKGAPKKIEYWYNLFWNPQTTTEEKRRDKVRVE